MKPKQLLILISLLFFVDLSHANCKTWPKDQDGTINTSSDDRSFYIICENDNFKRENDECQLRHWNQEMGRENIYTSNKNFALGKQSR